jgi:hypothetical protein
MTDYIKAPATTAQYIFDRTDYLAPTTKITGSTWLVPADLTKVADGFNDTSTRITLSGGQVNTSYAVYNDIEIDDGTTLQLAFLLRVVDALLVPGPPTELEKQLTALRVAITEAGISGTAEYQIANRSKRRYSLDELLNLEKRLVERLNAERRAAGAGTFKNHYVRPVEPGP